MLTSLLEEGHIESVSTDPSRCTVQVKLPDARMGCISFLCALFFPKLHSQYLARLAECGNLPPAFITIPGAQGTSSLCRLPKHNGNSLVRRVCFLRHNIIVSSILNATCFHQPSASCRLQRFFRPTSASQGLLPLGSLQSGPQASSQLRCAHSPRSGSADAAWHRQWPL